jgi:hypothetical protein|tara:strand:- start:481 stop:654 length:174 start_codon:yes stop_codon:yes gene_type:complete
MDKNMAYRNRWLVAYYTKNESTAKVTANFLSSLKSKLTNNKKIKLIQYDDFGKGLMK